MYKIQSIYILFYVGTYTYVNRLYINYIKGESSKKKNEIRYFNFFSFYTNKFLFNFSY